MFTSTVRPRFWLLAALALVLSAVMGTTLFVGSGAAPAAEWILQGRVYEGEAGLEPPNSLPLAGVTVCVHAAASPYPDEGRQLRCTTTDATGWYGLSVYDDDGGFAYYAIRETDPPGYLSAGATSVAGVVKTANWIEYAAPLAGKTLTGNKFWDKRPATATSTPTVTRTRTPTATRTRTPTPSVTLTPSRTPSGTTLPTMTGTRSPTPTNTSSPMPGTPTGTRTRTPTPTPTQSPIPNTATPTSGPSLSGRVYEGALGDEDRPLAGVTVELYCSATAGALGERLTAATTNASGWYGLAVAQECAFYNIVETDPLGYASVGASSVGGVFIGPNWIQYAHPLAGKTTTGNRFWDERLPTSTPTATTPPGASPTATATRTRTRTPTLTPTQSPVPKTPTPTVTGTPGPTPVSVTVCAAADTFVHEYQHTVNFGDKSYLGVRYGTGPGEPYALRSLLRFDLAFIPAGSEIVSGTFQALMTGGSGVDPVTISLYPVNAAWGELTATWDNQPAAAGQAAAQAAVGTTSSTVVSWDVTELVQSWFADPSSNLGFKLQGPESGAFWARSFESRHYATFCPRLVLAVHPSAAIPTATPTTPPTPTATPTSACTQADAAGNSFANAATLSLFTETDEYICPSGDLDWWKFPVISGREILLSLSDFPTHAPIDYDLLLVNPSQNVVASSSRTGANKDESISYIADATGDYRAVVRGKGVGDWSNKQTYTLLARVCPVDEAGDSFEWADLLTPGIVGVSQAKTTQGYICPTNDQDWYYFAVPDEDKVSIAITLTNLAANFNLQLYSPDETLVDGSYNPEEIAETISYTAIRKAGYWRVRVIPATSSAYHATQPYHLQVSLDGLVRDLVADAIEVTQGIQNLANGVPLVGGKTTYARAYASQTSLNTSRSVEAQLHGSHLGAAFPDSPLSPVNNGTITVTNPSVTGGYDRAGLNAGWLFKLPDSWVRQGVNLRLVVDPRKLFYDNNRSNNELTVKPTVDAKAPVCLVMVPVRTEAPKPSTKDPNFWYTIGLFKRLWPAYDVRVWSQSSSVEELEVCWWGPFPYFCYGPYEMTEDSSKVLAALKTRDTFTDDPDECDDLNAWTHYVGMVHPDSNTGSTLGTAYLSAAQAWVKMGPYSSPTPTWAWPDSGRIMAHELAHNYGRRHVGCGVTDGLDGSYPYPVCQLDAAGQANYYGFDINTRSPIAPTAAADFMSYRTPAWASDYTYKALFNALSSPPLAQVEQSGRLLYGTTFYVSGIVTPTTGQGELGYAWAMPAEALGRSMARKWQAMAAPGFSAAGLRPDEPAVHLRLLAADGRVLDDRAATLVEGQEDPIRSPAVYAFALTMAAPTGEVSRMELLDGDRLLASRQYGPAAPQVTLLQPTGGQFIGDELTIVWRATDPDAGDMLLHTVQYSADDGQAWRALVSDFPGPPDSEIVSLTLHDLSGLPGGERSRIRVLTSDGYHTGQAVSEPFFAPNRPPEAYILSPLAEQVIPASEAIVLSGGAADAENTSLAGDALQWILDGRPVGGGAEQVVGGLAPGSHFAALVARDAAGQERIAEAPFTVGLLNIPPGPAPALDGFCDDAAYEGAVPLALAPYLDGSAATVRLLHTEAHLWACFSGLARSANGRDGRAGLRVDVNDSGGEVAQPDDYGFYVTETGRSASRAGDGQGGFEGEGPAVLAAAANIMDDGWSGELRIEAAALDGWGHLIRLLALHEGLAPPEEERHWPHLVAPPAPDTWGHAILGEGEPAPRRTYLPVVLKQ